MGALSPWTELSQPLNYNHFNYNHLCFYYILEKCWLQDHVQKKSG